MSIGYSLVKLVLKIKGVKKSWSKDPIDYIKKRKEDIPVPSKRLLKGNTIQTKTILETTVTEITPTKSANEFLLLYCPGGAFVYGPTENNWDGIARIVKQTQTKAWMVDYPKAPEHKIDGIAKNIYATYMEALKTYHPSKIICIGDSVGGNMLVSLTQRLIREQKALPNRLILITPMLDASMSNPRIKDIDPIDPILSYKGVYSAKKMCAGDLSLKDPMISPVYGSLNNFPPIHIFMATHDILMPDQEVFIDKIKEEGSFIEVIVGEGMPHIWPLLPVFKEGAAARKKISAIINAASLDEK